MVSSGSDGCPKGRWYGSWRFPYVRHWRGPRAPRKWKAPLQDPEVLAHWLATSTEVIRVRRVARLRLLPFGDFSADPRSIKKGQERP